MTCDKVQPRKKSAGNTNTPPNLSKHTAAMPLTSRKRKASHNEADEEAARAVFQKHFEAQFAPLPEPVQAVTDDRSDEEEDGSEDGGEDEDEEWGGISDDEEEAVEVVDHTSKEASSSTMGKRELKDFMVRATQLPSWPPTSPNDPG